MINERIYFKTAFTVQSLTASETVLLLSTQSRALTLPNFLNLLLYRKIKLSNAASNSCYPLPEKCHVTSGFRLNWSNGYLLEPSFANSTCTPITGDNLVSIAQRCLGKMKWTSIFHQKTEVIHFEFPTYVKTWGPNTFVIWRAVTLIIHQLVYTYVALQPVGCWF